MLAGSAVHLPADAAAVFSRQWSISSRPSLSVGDVCLTHSHPAMLMHASCGAPLHGLGGFVIGAFTGFSATMTFVGGAGFSITTTVGGVTTATGASAGGSDAQPAIISAPSNASAH